MDSLRENVSQHLGSLPDPMANLYFGTVVEPDPNITTNPPMPCKMECTSNTKLEPLTRPSRAATTAAKLLATYDRGPGDRYWAQYGRTGSRKSVLPKRTSTVDLSGRSVGLGEEENIEQLKLYSRLLEAVVDHCSLVLSAESLVGNDFDCMKAQRPSYSAMIGSPFRDKWDQAISLELDDLITNYSFILTGLHPGERAVSSRWI